MYGLTHPSMTSTVSESSHTLLTHVQPVGTVVDHALALIAEVTEIALISALS